MKNVTRITVVLFALAMLAIAIPANAQRGGSITPVLRTAFERINTIQEEGGTIERAVFDMIRSEKSIIMQFNSRYTYTIYPIGDATRMDDIDIKVYRRSGSSWEEIENHAGDLYYTPYPFYVDPNYTEDYKITLNVYRFKEGYSVSYFGLIIESKDYHH